MQEKPIGWLGSSLSDLREFPDEARRVAGYELSQVQFGFMPTDWKPMAAVGPGVQEIRIRTEGEFRVLYVAKYAEAVYVLHAFEKKTRKTSRADIALARHRHSIIGRRR